ncbi:MAG: hypothetical protein HY660_12765 [Armatimonadetes bacterium]|nr:hypothetical protein [Armatimonadota bacterium]
MEHQLNADERRVLEILLEDWKDVLRCTNVEQAMARVGLPFSDATRRRLAGHLLHDPAVQAAVRWAPHTYILTNDERLIARAALRQGRDGRPVDASGLAPATGLPADAVADGLEALAWLGITVGDRRAYRLAPGHESFLEGLGFNFHEVVLDSGERFNVNCFFDFVLLVNPQFRDRRAREGRRRSSRTPGMTARMLEALEAVGAAGLVRHACDDRRVVLRDACAHCADPITIVVNCGRLADVEPEGAMYLRGGG